MNESEINVEVSAQEVTEVTVEENPPVLIEKKKRLAIFDKLSRFLFTLVVFLLPVFFLPVSDSSVDVVKKGFIGIGIILAFVFWLISKLEEGVVIVPHSSLLRAGFLILSAYLISALVSISPSGSLFGYGYETGTFLSIAVFYLLMVLGAIYFQSEKKTASFFKAILASSVVICLMMFLHLWKSDFSLWGFLHSPNDNLIGKWNDMAIFYGFVSVVSLYLIEAKQIFSVPRWLKYLAFVISTVGLVVADFIPGWCVFGIFSLAIFANRVMYGGGVGVKRWLRPSLLAVTLSLFLLIFGGSEGFIGRNIISYHQERGVATIEARPSFNSTMSIVSGALANDPVFGSGPNMFERIWRQNRPDGVYETMFWNTDFSVGYGILPTTLATVGLFGFLSWVIFLVFFLINGFRAPIHLRDDTYARSRVLVSFLGALYLWIFFVIYIPDNTILALSFIMTGLFVASLRSAGYISEGAVPLLGSKYKFASILVTVLVIMIGLTGAYVSTKKYLAAREFQKAYYVANLQGDLELAEGHLLKAIKLDPEDQYYRSLADVYILKLGNIMNDTQANPDEARTKFEGVLASAISAAMEAKKIDSNNPANHITLGRVYEAIVPLNIEGSYDATLKAYNEGIEAVPRSPAVYLHLARLEFTRENYDKSREYIETGLSKKSNFSEALFLLSQIEAREGNLKNAIKNAEQVVLLEPSYLGGLFQLGLLRYSSKDYTGSVSALERAVSLNGDYANARYFLGLAYSKLGKVEESISQFEKIKILNPDNAEIKKILANLYAGKAPIPPGEEPEGSSSLPIEE